MTVKRKRKRSTTSFAPAVIIAFIGALAGSAVGNIIIKLIDREWLNRVLYLGGHACMNADGVNEWVGGLGRIIILEINGGTVSYEFPLHLLAVITAIAAVITFIRLR